MSRWKSLWNSFQTILEHGEVSHLILSYFLKLDHKNFWKNNIFSSCKKKEEVKIQIQTHPCLFQYTLGLVWPAAYGS